VKLMTDILFLIYSFFKIGILGFGGGYAMMSMIMMESEKFSVTAAQMADLNALDMIIPGPIAINAATYVGYLNSGYLGSAAATVGVILPSFILVLLVMHFIIKYRESTVMNGILFGIRPAAVGLISAAALMIAKEVLIKPEADAAALLVDPLKTVSFLMLGIFTVTAVANIRFKVNPILLTVLAGIAGAFFAY